MDKATILITIGNVISLTIFAAIFFENQHVIKSHIRVIGEEHANLAYDMPMKILHILYLLSLVGLIILSYFVLLP